MITDIIVFSLLGIGMIFALVRLIKGPTPANRVISLDTLNIIVIGLIALLAHQFDNGLYLDIAIVYAILAFLETIVFARYLEGKHGDR
jgi:multicomponent Na+:H+ antiporter subunit F